MSVDEPLAAGARAPAVELLLRFARAGHDAGYPTADLEERVLGLARSLDLPDAEVAATPTTVEVSLGVPPRQQTYRLRVRPTAVDLDAIARLDELVLDTAHGAADPELQLAALDDIVGRPLRRPWPLLLAAYALAGAALTPVIGGGWREAAGAAAIGLVVGAIAVPAARSVRAEPMAAPLAAVAASVGAAALVALGLRGSPDLITLAALVTFLPGMTLTIGIRDLATQHLQSGVANTASASVQLLGLVFGVAVGRSIAESWFGPQHAVIPGPGFAAGDLLAAVAAGLAFTLILRAQLRNALLMCTATVLALGANGLAAELVGGEAAVFAAALAVGVVGAFVGSRLRRSPLVFIVPGVLMLVPGSAGFNSVLQLLTDQTVGGVAAAFDTCVTAMSIAYGLMAASFVQSRTTI